MTPVVAIPCQIHEDLRVLSMVLCLQSDFDWE